MKIGIVGSGYDMLPLFTVLHTVEHDFHIFWDQAYGSRTEKSLLLQRERIEQGIVYLREQGVEKIIVPMWYELECGSEHSDIIELYSSYLHDIVFPHSLVGKIGGIGVSGSDLMQHMQKLLWKHASLHVLTARQSATKAFQKPFSWRMDSMRLFVHMVADRGNRDRMLRKLLKQYMRYFTDAAVDTLLPCDRSFLRADTLMRKLCRERKLKYHGRESFVQLWKNITTERLPSPYAVTIHMTDTSVPKILSKKRRFLLERGTSSPIKYISTDMKYITTD